MQPSDDVVVGLEGLIDLAAEIATLKDALKRMNNDLEALFRAVARESACREAAEQEVDAATAALARVQRHQDSVALESIARNRANALADARSRLDALNADSWEARVHALEDAKARLSKNRFVPDGRRWRGPLMQRALQQGLSVSPAKLRHAQTAAAAEFLSRACDLAEDVAIGPSPAQMPPAELHERWCKMALLSRGDSAVALSVSSLLDLWLAPAADREFSTIFERYSDPRVVRLPRVVTTHAPPALDPSLPPAIPPEYMLPPTKRIMTPRATFRDVKEARTVIHGQFRVLFTRLKNIASAHVVPDHPDEPQPPPLEALVSVDSDLRLFRRDAYVAHPQDIPR